MKTVKVKKEKCDNQKENEKKKKKKLLQKMATKERKSMVISIMWRKNS